MEPALIVAFLWALFAATHIGLTARPIRAPLAARFGEAGFVLLFSLVAAATFTGVVTYYAAHRFEGAPGPALGQNAAFRWLLMALIVAGLVLATAGLLASYFRSPYVVLGDRRVGTPRGIERITRHPFFAGVALVALPHALLAASLTGTVFFAGFAAVAIVGAAHQDRKLLAQRGQPYADYLAATSAIPFAAILSGRQRLVLNELPWCALAASGVIVVGLRWVHDGIFAYGGWIVVGVTVGGAAYISILSLRRTRAAAQP
ncbi:MAG: NnrU family protein [Nevskiales bacterium]